MISARDITNELIRLSNRETRLSSMRFFKTGPGEYGEGDQFRGIRVPVLRTLARQAQTLPLAETTKLLHHSFHEDRLLALLILVRQFSRGNEREKTTIYSLFAGNTSYVNNWDLVDSSAPYISGPFLFSRDRKPLYRWVASTSLWERRIAIMSTFHFIRQGDYDDTLRLSALLLNDPEDLIHKAVGWMLREVGNKEREREEVFLRKYATVMPRTMLRYAIEKFPERTRKMYLAL